ncbi:hypothetical protein N7488_005510 [Penicillium malachiteum]|nr:hypothetical protein N7488_005510 [Penicillium malachiteum]
MSNNTPPIPILDHIVVLVSHKTLLGIAEHIEGQFILAPGGDHADGLTTNRLILLPDGVYLELIAFFDNIDPERRRQHRWGNEAEGTIIDWAFTLPSESDFKFIQKRIGDADTDLFYTDPIPGGRTKPDGTVLKWAVCTSKDAQGDAVAPGSLPFWCLDRTPRANRVPYEAESHLTRHPNGVQGVLSVSVQIPTSDTSNFKGAYDGIFGGHWQYSVPSGFKSSQHSVSLTEGERSVHLVLHGPRPGKVELLPGLLLHIESA